MNASKAAKIHFEHGNRVDDGDVDFFHSYFYRRWKIAACEIVREFSSSTAEMHPPHRIRTRWKRIRVSASSAYG